MNTQQADDVIAEVCKAEEWQRDGRGWWAMRCCINRVRATDQATHRHVFGPWQYHALPAGTDLAALVEMVSRQPQELTQADYDETVEIAFRVAAEVGATLPGAAGYISAVLQNERKRERQAASVSHQPQPYTYGDQLLRRCEPGTRKGHFFIDGAPKCQCNTEAAPIAPVVVNSQTPKTTVTFPDAVSAKMLETELDVLRPKLDACAPYLKDGETPVQCIERNRRDLDMTLGLLATEKERADGLRKVLRDIRRDLSADQWHRAIDTALATYHRSRSEDQQEPPKELRTRLEHAITDVLAHNHSEPALQAAEAMREALQYLSQRKQEP